MSGTTLIVRADGGPELGLGHLVRCGALACAWQAEGGHVVLLTRSPEAATPLEGLDHAEIVALPDGTRGVDELIERARNGPGWALIDHYDWRGQDFARMREAGVGVAVIDDLGDRDLSAVDWLLDQGPAARDLPDSTGPDCERLLGPRWALLRPEFARVRSGLDRRPGRDDRRLLITLGGGEQTDRLATLMQALDAVSTVLELRIVIAGVPSEGLLARVRASHHATSLLDHVRDMADQMAWADLAVASGGVSALELCCLGVPMVLCELSDDQGPNVSALAALHCALSLGRWHDESTPRAAAEAVSTLLSEPESRDLLSGHAWALVDGRGAGRAAQSLAQRWPERS